MSANDQSSITTRLATHDDYVAIDRIGRQVHDDHARAEPERFRSGVTAVAHDYFRALIECHDARIVIAECDGNVVGFVVLKLVEAPPLDVFLPRSIVRIDLITVDLAFRNRGIGRLLMQAAEAWAVEVEADEIDLNVYEFNADAIAFHERLGFRTMRRTMSRSLG